MDQPYEPYDEDRTHGSPTTTPAVHDNMSVMTNFMSIQTNETSNVLDSLKDVVSLS
jgi:hypothetical protein